MRFAILLVLAVALAGCNFTSPPYTQADITQVNEAYHMLHSNYLDFKKAYWSHNDPLLRTSYHRVEQACRIVDVIDNRDSIDPNVKLFSASAELDNFCNDIEVVHAVWAKDHHYHYQAKLLPDIPEETFLGADKCFATMPDLLAHPDGYA